MSNAVKPAALPAVAADEIVGLSFQNAGAGTLAAGVATFGQAFAQGDVPAGARLVARVNGELVPVQMDVKTRHEDGSVRHAVLSVERPEMAAGEVAELVLAARAPGAAPPAGAPLDMAALLAGRSFEVDVNPASGGAAHHIDVLAELRGALADGTASVWQSGPLAAQARVAVDLPGSQRLLFDVTVFEDGEFKVNALFNNDEAMTASGGRVAFEAVVRMDGAEVLRKSVSQAQYQNWRETFSSDEANGGHLTGDPSEGWLNIRQDIGYLSKAGAIAHYDTAIGIDQGVLGRWEAMRATTPGWGEPLANNNILRAMGSPGGREDLGITTAGNSAWLMSQDVRAAAYALDQAEVSGAIPWNHYDTAHGTWLNTENYPRIWTDVRGGTGRPGDPTSGGLTQQVANDTGWAVARSHQPDLSYIPYLLTGERMHLDALQAQASFSLVSIWPAVRGPDGGGAGHVVGEGGQLRSSAWAMRQIENAAWISPDGSLEKAFFGENAAANWKHLLSKLPQWTAAQGEAHGYIPYNDEIFGDVDGAITVFQQEYFAAIAIQAAARGNADAMAYLNWASNFLVGRFFAEEKGFSPRDGVAYRVAVAEPGGKVPYKTWAEIGAATEAHGFSNGETGWNGSQGEYGRLGMATLAGLWHLTGDPRALEAYKALAAESPAWTDEATFTRAPNYAVTIPGIYGGSIVGTDANDTIAPKTGAGDLRADLGEGLDTLTLGAGGNTGWVRNVEVLNGGRDGDNVTLHAADTGTVVDLGAGNDTLRLGDAGGRVTVRNVETLVGGAGDDDVALGAPTSGLSIDLGAGNDRLRLADGGNTVTLRNVETIVGGAGNDSVTLGAPASGLSIDLGAGSDRLQLANGTNTLTLSNVETVAGHNGNDAVTLATVLRGGLVDLGMGTDRLALADGGNALTVSLVEEVVGGAGDDAVTVAAASSGTVLDLGAGSDRVVFGTTLALTLRNVEQVVGSAGADRITLADSAVAGNWVDGGAGGDTLVLAAGGGNTLAVANVEAVQGGAGDDALTFTTGLAAGAVVDGGAGQDRVALGGAFSNTVGLRGVEQVAAGGGNDTVSLLADIADGVVDLGGGRDRLDILGGGATSVTVRNVEAINGNGGRDNVALGDNAAGVVVNLGGNADRLALGGGTNSVTVSNVETVDGGAGNDSVTFATSAWNAVVDLGAGVDRLALANVGNVVTVSNAETIAGGTAGDIVTLAAPTFGTSVDLGAGADRLVLGDAGNALTVANVEAIQGGAGGDAVTLWGAAPIGLTVDLGAGNDSLALSSQGGALTARNVERVAGAGGADAVTLGTALVGGAVDLGGGADRLQLANGTNTLTVANTETILGNSGADTVTLSTAASGVRVELGMGADRLVLANGTNAVTLSGVETVAGGTGADTVTLADGIAGGVFDLGGGSDRLVLSNQGSAVTTANTELVVGGAGGDRITATGTTVARLEGGGGGDVLVGGLGDDALVGGAANDVMTGGAGADRFLFLAASDSAPSAADVITDFDGAGDLLVFQGMLRGSFDFRGAGAFLKDGESQARYLEQWRQLQVDADGDGQADMSITLQNVPLAQLSAADFVWTAPGQAGTPPTPPPAPVPAPPAPATPTVVVGTGRGDTVALSGPANNTVVDLGDSYDWVILSSAGPNGVALRNVEGVRGGGLADTVTFETAVAQGSVELGGGSDKVVLSSVGANSLSVANTEWVVGGARSDTVTAGDWAAIRLQGMGGDDTLRGGYLADTIEGGAGQDVMTGKGGADVFVFRAGDSAAAAPDTVTDFRPGQDKLAFEGMVRGAFDYRGSAAFAPSGNSEARLAGNILQVDADGDGAVDLAVRLDGVTALSPADFLWS